MKVILDYSEEIHFTASVRQFSKIHIDEPKSFHGTNRGPSSVEYILIGIGGCLGSSFVYCLKLNEMLSNIENLIITIDGKLSHIEPNRQLRLVSVDADITFNLKNKEFAKGIEECVRNFQEHCVVTNSIIQGISTNVNISW